MCFFPKVGSTTSAQTKEQCLKLLLMQLKISALQTLWCVAVRVLNLLAFIQNIYFFVFFFLAL